MTGAKQLQTYTAVPAEVIGAYYGWLFALCFAFGLLEALSYLRVRALLDDSAAPRDAAKTAAGLFDDKSVDPGGGSDSLKVHPVKALPPIRHPSTGGLPAVPVTSKGGTPTLVIKSDNVRVAAGVTPSRVVSRGGGGVGSEAVSDDSRGDSGVVMSSGGGGGGKEAAARQGVAVSRAVVSERSGNGHGSGSSPRTPGSSAQIPPASSSKVAKQAVVVSGTLSK